VGFSQKVDFTVFDLLTQNMKQTTIARVMVIDDDPVNNKITKLLLRKHNWPAEVDVFEDGLEALGVLKESMESSKPAPEVILLDMDMPAFSGWDFMNEYSTLPDSLTGQSLLYMVSSSINPPDMKRAGRYPLIRAYIAKPLTPKVLAQILADHHASTQV
jgi:CheY-like chemotaxis protein